MADAGRRSETPCPCSQHHERDGEPCTCACAMHAILRADDASHEHDWYGFGATLACHDCGATRPYAEPTDDASRQTAATAGS